MTQNSPVPDWFGKSEADQRSMTVAKARGLGCGLSLLLGLVTAGSVYWAVSAELRAKGLEERLRIQRAETERPLEARPAKNQERPAVAPPMPTAPAVAPVPAIPEPAVAPTASPEAAPANADAPGGGQRSAADIQREMNRLRPAFRRCYDVVLKDDPAVNGRIELKLVISARGAVTSASASPTGNLPPSVGACVAKVARTASFDPADGPTTVTYPLVFRSN
ncbi:MAG: AgmX/PglI C-terminal domain-containing protein [Polyangiaceae bacterium]